MKKIYLIDCPGVVYNPSESDEEKVLKGVVRVELVENPSDYIPAVLKKVKPEYMARTYKIGKDWKDPNDFLEKVAQKYGKLLKGGEPDVNTISKMILNDWQRGKIPFFVPPPGCELPPKVENENTEENEKKKDQDFSQIKVVHEYDDEDLNIDETNAKILPEENGKAGDDIKDEALNENPKKRKREDSENEIKSEENESEQNAKISSESNEKIDLNEQVVNDESKKRKREESENENNPDEKRIKTTSGTFVVTDQ